MESNKIELNSIEFLLAKNNYDGSSLGLNSQIFITILVNKWIPCILIFENIFTKKLMCNQFKYIGLVR